MSLKRWDGYSKPLMKFIHEIYVLCYHLLSEENRNTLKRTVLENTVVFLNIVTGLNLDTARKFDESSELQSFIEQMKRNVTDHERQITVDNDQRETMEKKVSAKIEFILFNTVSGFPLEVLKIFNRKTKWTNGILMLRRLIETFQPSLAHIALIPYLFDWKKENLYKSWINYNNCLIEQDFLNHHPTLMSTVITRAKLGFQNSEEGIRLLDHIRVKLGDGNDYMWDVFKETVNEWFGDPYRREFETAVLENKVENQALGLQPDWKNDSIPQICRITNYKESPDQYPELDFLKNALKLIKKCKKQGVKKTTKGKKIPPICGWCGKNHPSWSCKQNNLKKWSKHFCTNCGGQGHPRAVCPQPWSKEGKPPQKGNNNILLLTSPMGVFRIDQTKLPEKVNFRNNLMLDSGAAISVAPRASFKNIPLQRNARYKYNLQSAQGRQLNIYGEKKVPFTFGNTKVYITVIICDVTLPLMSTNDMVKKGISVFLDKYKPCLKVNGNDYELKYQNKHFWMKQNYNKEGIFGVTKIQHDISTISTPPLEVEDSSKIKNFESKRDTENGESYEINAIDSGANCNVVNHAKTSKGMLLSDVNHENEYQVGEDNVPGSSNIPPERKDVINNKNTNNQNHKQNENVIIVPNKLVIDPEWDQIIQNHGLSEEEVTNLNRNPKEIVRIKGIPKLPPEHVINEHNVTHIPHQQWCKHCVEGRMVKDHSLTVPKSERLLRTGVLVQMDFFSYHDIQVLALVETTSGYMCARIVKEKTFTGVNDQKVTIVENFLKDIGKREVILQCDGESTLRALVDTVAERFTTQEGPNVYSITGRYTSPYTSNSNGSVERAIRLIRDQVRVMFGALCHRFEENFRPNTKFLQWLVRHATWLLNRIVAQNAHQDKTRYEVLFGRKYNKNNLYEFLTPIVVVPQNRTKSQFKMKMYEQQPLGLYLGRYEKGDSHIVLTENGSIMYAHTVRNLTEMSVEKQRLIIKNLDEAPKPNANGQQIFDETYIDPDYNLTKVVATRAVGSKQRFRALTQDEKQEKIRMFGPTTQPRPGGMNLRSQMMPQGKIQNKEDEEMKPKRDEIENTDFEMKLDRKRGFDVLNKETDYGKSIKPIPLRLEEDAEMETIEESEMEIVNDDENIKGFEEEEKIEHENEVPAKINENKKTENESERKKEKNLNKRENNVKMKVDKIEKDIKMMDVKPKGKEDRSDSKRKEEEKLQEFKQTNEKLNKQLNNDNIIEKLQEFKQTNEKLNKQLNNDNIIEETREQEKEDRKQQRRMIYLDELEKFQKTNQKINEENMSHLQELENFKKENEKLNTKQKVNKGKMTHLQEPGNFHKENEKLNMNRTTKKGTKLIKKKTKTEEKKTELITEPKIIELPDQEEEIKRKESAKEETEKKDQNKVKELDKSKETNPHERFTMEQKLAARERIKRPLPAHLVESFKRNKLFGYQIINNKVYNPFDDEIIDGYNINRGKEEDILRTDAGLPAVGSKEEWQTAKQKRQREMEKGPEAEKQLANEKTKIEVECNRESDLSTDVEMTDDAGLSEQESEIPEQEANPSDSQKNFVVTEQGKKQKILNIGLSNLNVNDRYSQLMAYGWKRAHEQNKQKNQKRSEKTSTKIIESINMIVDAGEIPDLNLTLFANKFKNQILAVTVSKREVEKSLFPDKWEQARKKEMDSLIKFDVFEVVDQQTIPNDHPTPIGCRWLYTLKDYPYDTYQKNTPDAEKNARYKARLIVQGMNEEIDDTYSPTPSAESVRIGLTIAQIGNWKIKFADVSTAFLHAGVIGNPYVYPPETEKLENKTKVWKLKKALYGLKSAPKAWYEHVTNLLKHQGWKKSDLDECVFFKEKKTINKNKITSTTELPISGIIIIYVDDLIVAAEEEIEKEFFKEFKKSVSFSSDPEELVVNGPAITFLGFQYSRKKDFIIIDPREYTDKVLEAFKHTDAQPRKTTGDVGQHILDMNERKTLKKDGKEHKQYRRLVGQTLWLSSVRRDIAFAVKELSKYVHDPTEDDVKRGEHLLRYLAGTKDECVHLRPRKEKTFTIESFTDADLGNCRTSRRSTSGGCISLNGSIVFTWAKQQDTVADSSTESEYIAMVQACKQIKYVQQFLDEFNIVLGEIPVLHIDNTAAMEMITSNIKSRVKHLDRKMYWIREFITNKNVVVKYVDTKNNLADIFTKYVPNTVLERIRSAIMGREDPPRTDPETEDKIKESK